MNSLATVSPSAHTPLSIKAAFFGFVASTTAMTTIMVLLGKFV